MKTQIDFPAAPARQAGAWIRFLARYACLRIAPGLLAALVFLARPAPAAVTEAWVRRYGNVVDQVDEALAVAVDGSGNVVVTGYSNNGPPNYDIDFYTAKYAAADGALIWERRYNGPANSADAPRAMAVDAAGNVVVTGSSHNTNGNADAYTAKYAAGDGALLWEQRYNGPANGADYADAVAVDGSGNVVVTGGSRIGAPNYDNDYYTAKYAAATGALLWEKRYNGPASGDDGATAVAVDGSGNVVVTGASIGAGGIADYYTAKYAATDGALLWEQRYSGPANGTDYAYAVAVDGGGNAVVTGFSYNGSFNSDYYTAKYAAADGALLWDHRFNGGANQDDEARAVAVDGAGNVVVTGYAYDGGLPDYYTAKYAAADGALLWDKTYNDAANHADAAQAVVVDGSGNAVVTGWSAGGSGGVDYYTAKYASADGALLWEQRYNGPVNGEDVVNTSRGLALGPDGSVAITGSSDAALGPQVLFNYATVLYREVLALVAVEVVLTGILLRTPGFPGGTYEVQRASRVNGPWLTLATLTAPLDGRIEYLDTNAPAGQAFYRTALRRPPNDAFANATPIQAIPALISAANDSATKEPGEPYHAGNAGGPSLWWSWTAPGNGGVTLSTIGSDFDTLLAVYLGNSITLLGLVAADDDGGGNFTSRLVFNAQAGATYRIAVDGYDGASGNIQLHVTMP